MLVKSPPAHDDNIKSAAVEFNVAEARYRDQSLAAPAQLADLSKRDVINEILQQN